MTTGEAELKRATQAASPEPIKARHPTNKDRVWVAIYPPFRSYPESE